MTLLNDADKVYAGSAAASRVYAGANLVWELDAGGAWTPDQITSGMYGWWDASDAASLTFSGANLTAWADQSPAARNLSRAGASGPTLTSINSLGALAFSAGQGMVTGVAQFNDFTVCAVFGAGATSPTYQRIVDQAFDTGWWLGRTGSSATWGGGVVQGAPPYGLFVPLADSDVHQISSMRSGTAHTISGNGGTSVQTGTVTGSITSSVRVTVGDTATNDAPMTGNIAEVLVWSRALTTDEMAKTEGYLAWKWGIQAKLPVGHPYRSAPPTTGAGAVTVAVAATAAPATAASVALVGVSAAVAATAAPATAAVATSVTAAGITATGGTITDVNRGGIPGKLHTFTASGDFVVTAGSGTVDVELVGGGGGGAKGGTVSGGGGSAGERKVVTAVAVSAGTYSIVVGAGGADQTTAATAGNDGAASTGFSQTAAQGEGGASGNNAGQAGFHGSGGGGGSTGGTGGTGSSGRNGGAGSSSGTGATRSGGGGAGMGAAGASAVTGTGGAGGAGISSDFVDTGMSCCGGGGGHGGTTGGAGGANGGGTGASATSATATAGSAPGAGGGGGGFSGGSQGKAGAAGIVRVWYPT